MKTNEFKKLTENRLIYLDGATGSNLMKRGMPAGVCPEQWILEHPEVFKGLQREYVQAGTNILYAPTFTANRIKLGEYSLEDKIAEINRELVKLSREAAEGKALVAGDITMTGRQLFPIGDMDFEDLITVYKEQISLLDEAGVDLLVVETMMSLQETRAALIAAKEVCALPVMASLTFESDGRTLYGTDAVTAAVTLEKLGACAVGANCSTGPDKMAGLIEAIAGAVSIPVIAKPNAGMPSLNGQGETVYDMSAEIFAEEMIKLVEAGAGILGGCCGTTPEYIEKLVRATSAMPIGGRDKIDSEAGKIDFQTGKAGSKADKTGLKAAKTSSEAAKISSKSGAGLRYLSSERKTISFGLNSPFMIVGERINPTGKKKLQGQLREGNLDMVLSFAEEQEAQGAALLDINMGMSGIDEKEMMLKVLDEITMASNLPLSIDSSHVEVIEAALRRYPGRALINSISGETEKLEKLLPLAKKYGAMFILLPLSDKGLPDSLEEKIEIINKISGMALDLGMTKEDIVVDGLVTTAGVNPKAAGEVLEVIRYCKRKGFATICGLSNISFGLPERSFVNTAFLTMAIQAGLTMAIANPSQELLVNMAFASDLLMNKEGGDIRYIEKMKDYQPRIQAGSGGGAEAVSAKNGEASANEMSVKEISAREGLVKGASAKKNSAKEFSTKNASAGEVSAKNSSIENGKNALFNNQLYQDVMKGNRKQIKEHTKAAVESGHEAAFILNELLLPAIGEVGDLFDKGTYFLPQLIASAEAMKLSIEYLEPLLATGEKAEEMPVVVIATVEGDIHDIGKNLVALMLKNHGFQVIDLGKDVPREVIAEAAVKYHAEIIALSALMTTTMQEMKRVVDYVREKQIDAKIMIGGAVITADYAKEIGADGYSKDAADAVRVAKQLLGL
ncbi:MAG: homocysteine S-methyltransferase family protein [Clostridium sp.]|nr:homocysteine S-methyltransferase family protein [Clostridium sp.]